MLAYTPNLPFERNYYLFKKFFSHLSNLEKKVIIMVFPSFVCCEKQVFFYANQVHYPYAKVLIRRQVKLMAFNNLFHFIH